jgi:hypothetical protein
MGVIKTGHQLFHLSALQENKIVLPGPLCLGGVTRLVLPNEL